MARAIRPNGIELEYRTDGDPAGRPLLVVTGYTSQLISWDQGFTDALVDAGHYVIRFDNRDTGLSSKLTGTPNLAAVAAGTEEPPYRLSDMSADGFAVLDALGIERAHIAGGSMGGMIVQTMAIEHPERVISLTSIMSTTGERAFGQATPEASAVLMAPAPAEREAYLEHAVRTRPVYCSPENTPDLILARAVREYDRMFYPEGYGRQMAAIMGSGDRTAALRALAVPTLVIHGELDTLIQPSGGERTAELIPGATLLKVANMGHDLPPAVWGEVVPAIAAHTRAAEQAGL